MRTTKCVCGREHFYRDGRWYHLTDYGSVRTPWPQCGNCYRKLEAP